MFRTNGSCGSHAVPVLGCCWCQGVHGGAGAGDVLKDLARDAGQGYRPVVNWVVLLSFLEDRCNNESESESESE